MRFNLIYTDIKNFSGETSSSNNNITQPINQGSNNGETVGGGIPNLNPGFGSEGVIPKDGTGVTSFDLGGDIMPKDSNIVIPSKVMGWFNLFALKV